KKAVGQRKPRCRPNVVLVIELGSPEQRASRADESRSGNESIKVRIVYLPLVIVIENQFLFPPIVWFPIQVRPDQPFLRQQIVERSRRENGIRAPGVAQRVGDQTPDP